MAYPYNNYNGYPYSMQQQMPQQAVQQPQGGLIRATEAEAYNYPMAPNTSMIFTDGMRIFVKTTDASPFGGFKFEKFLREEPQTPKQDEYLTKAEFEAFKASLVSKEAAPNDNAK